MLIDQINLIHYLNKGCILKSAHCYLISILLKKYLLHFYFLKMTNLLFEYSNLIPFIRDYLNHSILKFVMKCLKTFCRMALFFDIYLVMVRIIVFLTSSLVDYY